MTGALNHSIKLGAPTSVAPASGFVTNNAMPTFSWNAPPSAGVFTYNLQADNNTTGATNVVNQVGLSGTSFTPSSAIADGMIAWRVQASDGTNVSPFTSNITFNIDTKPPAAVTLSGSVPSGIDLVTGVVAISSSGDKNATNGKAKAVDGSLGTFWNSAPRTTMQTEQITLDLGSTKSVGRVRLRSRS